MKKVLTILIILCACLNVNAALKSFKADIKDRDLGLGLYLGDPFGLNAKLALGNNKALSGVLGWSAGTYLHVDYLFFNRDVLASLNKADGIVYLYYGPGAYMKLGSDNLFYSGVRGTVGMEYMLTKDPFSIFLEFSPTFTIVSQVRLTMFAGIGFRYYFSDKPKDAL